MQDGNLEDEIAFYKHDDDEDRAAPEWDSENELSDLDLWLGHISDGEKWTEVSNARRGGRAISSVEKSLTPSTSKSLTSRACQYTAALADD